MHKEMKKLIVMIFIIICLIFTCHSYGYCKNKITTTKVTTKKCKKNKSKRIKYGYLELGKSNDVIIKVIIIIK